MTLPIERTRALVWAGGFLIEVARDPALPIEFRRNAVAIARHFPTVEDITSMSTLRYPIGQGVVLASPTQIDIEQESGRFGPLRYATRLAWPTGS